MNSQNKKEVAHSEYLRKGMRTPENRSHFTNSSRINGIKMSFDKSHRKINGFELHNKFSSRGSSAYSSSESRKYYKKNKNFVNENKKKSYVKSYDLYVK